MRGMEMWLLRVVDSSKLGAQTVDVSQNGTQVSI
jgi:hypothetical protein